MTTIPEALRIALQHHQSGRLQQAEAIYREILQVQPDHPDALHLLGVIAHQGGLYDLAIERISHAISLNPKVGEFHLNIGEAYRAQGKLDDAVASYQQALALKPAFAEAYSNLGIVLREQGKLEEAIGCCRQALALKPDFAEALTNLGAALRDSGRLEEAVASHRQALSLKPTCAEAHANLGTVLQERSVLEEAIAHYRQALALKPDSAEVYNNLGLALQAQGRLDEAVASYRQALSLKSDYAEAHSNLLLCLHYHPSYDATTIGAHYSEWYGRHAQKLATRIAPYGNHRDKERPLRIGYVSGDFKRHPVGYFVSPVLHVHNKSQVRVYCYSMVRKADDVTKRIQADADEWRSIIGVSDEAVTRLIRDDGIDILVDLSGHTAGNRLLVFARKPAPVQVTWIGFCTTTGLETMDYLITDGFYSPPGGARLFTEHLVKLPANHLCFSPLEYAPPVSPCPARANGYPTFGCFNNLAKVNAGVVAVWSTILQRVPDARLVLKTHSLNDQSTRERYLKQFQEHAIVPDRVDLLGYSPHAELLAYYAQVDVALDPFPYCGGWSTCEALWMGVPVITLAGASFLSHIGAGLLLSVGLPEMIARSPEEYVELAVGLSRNVDRLSGLRESLRARMAASPLCDATTFTRNLEQAYRTMWRKWCESPVGL